MNKKLLVGLIVLVALLSATLAGAAKDYRAERFDADWQLSADGSLAVVETVVFRFEGGPFTYVFRELPTDYADGVVFNDARMDGRQMSRGEGPGQVEVENGNPIKITWHFAPTSDATHAFELTYRVLGAVRKEVDADLFVWNFLPTDYEYAIDSATLRVAYPSAAQRVGPAEVQRGSATVDEGDGQIIFTAQNLRSDTPLTVALRFEPGSLIAESPAWQARAATVAQRAPGVIGVALAFLAAGTGWLVLCWRRGRNAVNGAPSKLLPLSAPPDDLPPALAGALINTGAQPSAAQAMAALFSLAQRGIITFEETAEKRWYRSPEFLVRLLPESTKTEDLHPHEWQLLDLLFTGKAGRTDSIKLSEVASRLPYKIGPFAGAVTAELIEKGLIDPARRAYGKRFTIIGVVLLLLLIPAVAAAAVLVRTFGGWPFLIPLALFLLSLIAFVMSATYSPRSLAGEEAVASWQGFRDYIKGVTQGREPSWDTRLFERYFSYAAAFGLPDAWAKAFRKQGGTEIPAWFRSISASGDDGMAAFIVMTSSAHSAGAGSGGAGGGGAGGGGGSGAG